MVKRLLVGLVAGGLIGALVAAAVVFGLHVVVMEGLVAYAAAVAVGVLTGLVTGKPIWAQGAKIEAGLKALFGAALAAAGMYAARSWLHLEVNLEAIQPGMRGALGGVPFAALPLVAGVLGGLYELDNTDEGPASRKQPKEATARGGAKKTRVSAAPDDDQDDVAVDAGKSAKRR